MLLNFEQTGIALLGVIFVWLGILSVLFYRLFSHYRKLTKGITRRDLKSVLEKILKDFDGEVKRIDELVKATEGIKQDNFHNIQKTGLVRFNPFAETGGDQSFCLAILDGNDSGLVISSLHSREATRIYAKPVRKGKAVGYELSSEEKRAIKNSKKVK